jgi:hypothetical protein
MDSLERPKQRKMYMRCGTWSVRTLYRPPSFKTVSRELQKYKLDLVGVKEVRWDKSCTEPADDYTFLSGNGNADHHLGTGFSVQKGTISAVRRVECVSDRTSYVILKDRWCDIIILNVHTSPVRRQLCITGSPNYCPGFL